MVLGLVVVVVQALPCWWRNDKAEIPPACAGSLGSPDYARMSWSVTRRQQTLFWWKIFQFIFRISVFSQFSVKKFSSTGLAIIRIWVSRTLLPFLWVLLILLLSLVMKKINWKLTNKTFSQHRPGQFLTWCSARRLWWGICVQSWRSSQLMLVYPHNSFFQLTHLAKRSFRK